MGELRRFTIEEVAVLDPAAVEAALQELDAVRRAAEAATAQLVACAEAAGAHCADGHRTPRMFAMAACNLSWADAGRLVQVGHLLVMFPSAFGLGVPQLHALAAVVANPRVKPHLPDAEELLVEQARVLHYDDYVAFLTRWVASVDPEGAAAAHDRAHRERRARVTVHGERGFLEVAAGATQMAFIQDVLAAYTDSEFLADWDEASRIHGEDTTTGLLTRTDAQRAADAAFAVFKAAADAANSQGAGSTTVGTVNIVIDEATLEAELIASCGGTRPSVDPVKQICRTTAGIQIDPRDALIAAMLGHVRRIVRDAQGVPIAVGRRQRLFTGAAREAILALNPGCHWTPCRQRPRQIDHLTPWARGGLTDPSNGGPACGHHNRLGTRGYTTVRGPNGEWHHYRPDGTEIGWRNGHLTRLVPPAAAA